MDGETSKQRFQKSLEFLDGIKGDSLEKSCSRATVWGSARQILAKGEVFAEPSLDQPQRGIFQPDEAAILETLAGYANYVSFDSCTLFPVKIGTVHPQSAEPHLHFEVTGPSIEAGQ